MVAIKKVVKYTRHKEKERKHSQEQGMEDVSAWKSCRKSVKFISNSVSCDFVYFLTRSKLKLNFVSSLPPPHINKNGQRLTWVTISLTISTHNSTTTSTILSFNNGRQLYVFFNHRLQFLTTWIFLKSFQDPIIVYKDVNGQGQRWDPRQRTGMTTRPTHFKCSRFFFSLFFILLMCSLKGTTSLTNDETRCPNGDTTSSTSITPPHQDINLCLKRLRPLRQTR